jgi:uncharacterized membrane protein YeaQ/YmgE (transglycosylase-associated protein family)
MASSPGETNVTRPPKFRQIGEDGEVMLAVLAIVALVALIAIAHPVGFIVGLAVSGLIIGALGRLLVPGRQPLGCLGTILAGVAGSFVAGLIGRAIWGHTYTPGIIMSVLGAALVVWAVTSFRHRSYN